MRFHLGTICFLAAFAAATGTARATIIQLYCQPVSTTQNGWTNLTGFSVTLDTANSTVSWVIGGNWQEKGQRKTFYFSSSPGDYTWTGTLHTQNGLSHDISFDLNRGTLEFTEHHDDGTMYYEKCSVSQNQI